MTWVAVLGAVVLLVVAVGVVLVVQLRRAVVEGVEAVARACSLTPDELTAQLGDDADLATVARRYGVDAEQVMREELSHSKRRWLATAATRAKVPPADRPPEP